MLSSGLRETRLLLVQAPATAVDADRATTHWACGERDPRTGTRAHPPSPGCPAPPQSPPNPASPGRGTPRPLQERRAPGPAGRLPAATGWAVAAGCGRSGGSCGGVQQASARPQPLPNRLRSMYSAPRRPVGAAPGRRRRGRGRPRRPPPSLLWSVRQYRLIDQQLLWACEAPAGAGPLATAKSCDSCASLGLPAQARAAWSAKQRAEQGMARHRNASRCRAVGLAAAERLLFKAVQGA